MNEPPTLIIWDGDEERTLVDRAKREAMQTPRAGRLLLSSYKREMIEVVVALTLLTGLGLVLYQQWQVARVLRQTLAEIRVPLQEVAAVRSDALLRAPEAPNRSEVERRVPANELGVDERAELEQQAAALIASNDFPAALRRYETLAEIFPDDRTLYDVVLVLRAKLRCDPSSGLGGSACR
ncbi:MAG: hypothetical protein WBN10_15150 [Polyangiales bacterium]